MLEPTDQAERAAVERLQSDFDVSRETLDRFEAYRVLLIKWSSRINLVGPSTLSAFWSRHILDSAQLAALAPDRARWVDFGSGAGFPGLVLAALPFGGLARHMVLVEASTKRCAFLREAARVLGVQAEIMNAKIETISPIDIDVVTARAFTSLDGLLTYAESWMGPDTIALFPKGEEVRTELDKASTNWCFEHKTTPSVSDPRGCVVEITGLSRRAN